MEKQLVAADKHGLISPTNPMALIADGYGDEHCDSDDCNDDSPNSLKNIPRKKEYTASANSSITTRTKSQDTCENDVPQKSHNSR